MKKQQWMMFLIIAVLLAVACGAMRTDDGPEKTLERFELAYNTVNAEAMLECIAPRYSLPLKSGMSVLSKIVGINVNDVLTMVPLFSMFDAGMTMPQIHFKVLDVKIAGDTATIDMEVTAQVNGAVETIRVPDAGFIRQNGNWYIDIDNGWQ